MIICGHRMLEGLVSKEKGKYNVVLFTNSEVPLLPFVKHHAKNYQHIPVDDLDTYDYKSYVAPRVQDVEIALQFAHGKEDLICACHAGISRSSAMAYTIQCKRSNVEKALSMLEDWHFPNRLIVYIGSRLLSNSKMWDEYCLWFKEKHGQNPSAGGKWPDEYLQKAINI